ncbi:MAG TPA: lipopolysaccharide assembly protein LapA domain-containing protein [Gallionellaceae bacterium]|nr:lipopolysaccharide assembly protein LapA domain-containing protein [Gallionellaceae bacterium]
MKYLIWLLRAFLFLILLSFAVKNDQPVVLSYFFGYEWHASLVLVLLLFFAAGTAIGMLAVLGNLLRQRKEIAALKKELRLKNKMSEEIEE